MKIYDLKNRIINAIYSVNVPYDILDNWWFRFRRAVIKKDILMPIIDDALTWLYSEIEKELSKYDDIKRELDILEKEKNSFNKNKELFEIEKQHIEKSLKIKYELSIEDIKNSLKLNHSEQGRELWNALLTIENLKSQIDFYKEQNKEYKEMMKDWFKTNNEALIKVAESKNNIIVK